MQNSSRQSMAATLIFVAGFAIIGAAWSFEIFGGYIPCPLCLKQREPYYLGLPIALAAAIGAYKHAPTYVIRALLALTGLIFAYGTFLAAEHAGVEWGFWAGPDSCSGDALVPTTAEDLFNTLQSKHIPSCSEASVRFLGLSFAGWNAIACLGLTLTAFWGAARANHKL